MASESVSVSGPVDIESTAKQPMAATDNLSSHLFYHGTRADLKPGDPSEPGYTSNYGKRKKATYVYLTGTLDAATWGAELAGGPGVSEIRIHVLGEWRVIYVAKLRDAVYVLHAFQKKTRRTSRHDIELARQRYRQIGGNL